MPDEALPDIVIGSGPSGMAAAHALLQRGRRVLLLDRGITLDPAAAALRDRLAESDPAGWTRADRALLASARRSESSESRRLFGSDFLFRAPEDRGEWKAHTAVHGLRPSFAHGGLSNGWGASVLPYNDSDITEWPLGTDELAPHYREIAALAHVTNPEDSLAELFPALSDLPRRSLPVSRQARTLMARLSARTEQLARRGVHFGLARQAVADDCRACGQCLQGCPYRLIFNSADALDRLIAHPRLDHRTGRIVNGFTEEADSVRVRWGEEILTGRRLFIGCGVLSTARLVLASLGEFERPVSLLDSAVSYLPALHLWNAGDPAREALHGLSQLFVEIDNPAVNPRLVHTQIYTYNALFEADLRHRMGALAFPAAPLISAVGRRLLVAQTFLHSDSSGTINLQLTAGGALQANARANPRTAPAMARARRTLGHALRAAGVVPLPAFRRDARLGNSFHCGGSFPMRREPTGLESDVWGRPAGLRRVHLVDASVFPSIPATTITLSVMANAHRIAARAPV